MHIVYLLLSGFVAAFFSYEVGARCSPMLLEAIIKVDEAGAFRLSQRIHLVPPFLTFIVIGVVGFFITLQSLDNFVQRWRCEWKGHIYPEYRGVKDLGTFDLSMCLVAAFAIMAFIAGFASPFTGNRFALSICAVASLPTVFQLMECWRKGFAKGRKKNTPGG